MNSREKIQLVFSSLVIKLIHRKCLFENAWALEATSLTWYNFFGRKCIKRIISALFDSRCSHRGKLWSDGRKNVVICPSYNEVQLFISCLFFTQITSSSPLFYVSLNESIRGFYSAILPWYAFSTLFKTNIDSFCHSIYSGWAEPGECWKANKAKWQKRKKGSMLKEDSPDLRAVKSRQIW